MRAADTLAFSHTQRCTHGNPPWLRAAFSRCSRRWIKNDSGGFRMVCVCVRACVHSNVTLWCVCVRACVAMLHSDRVGAQVLIVPFHPFALRSTLECSRARRCSRRRASRYSAARPRAKKGLANCAMQCAEGVTTRRPTEGSPCFDVRRTVQAAVPQLSE